VARTELSIIIDAPPEKVWASVSDLASHTEWMRDAVAIRFVSRVTAGEGAMMDCDTKVGPFRLTDRLLVTEWQPGRSIAIRHEGAVTGTGRFSLAAADHGRTRFTWSEQLHFPWWMGGPAAALAAGPVLARTWRQNLEALRSLIESR
jgi:uncharacterized protein YndB with AHSA1/START domain